MTSPPWYAPLTAEQREQLAALVEQSTGCKFTLPAHDTPAGWLTELAVIGRATSPRWQHWRRYCKGAGTFYNPRTGHGRRP